MSKSPSLWIVELEPQVWLASGEGDPPRTIKFDNAERFYSNEEACYALRWARQFRKFPQAVVLPVRRREIP